TLHKPQNTDNSRMSDPQVILDLLLAGLLLSLPAFQKMKDPHLLHGQIKAFAVPVHSLSHSFAENLHQRTYALPLHRFTSLFNCRILHFFCRMLHIIVMKIFTVNSLPAILFFLSFFIFSPEIP